VIAIVRDQWPLLVPAIVGLGLYAGGTNLPLANVPNQPSTRLVAPFLMVFLGGIASGLRLSAAIESQAAIAALAKLGVVTLVIILVVGTDRDLAVIRKEQSVPLAVAQALHQSGVPRGATVGILGRKFDRDHDHEYWARLARVRIVCAIPDDETALRLPPERWSHLLTALTEIGVKALVYKPLFNRRLGSDWQPLGAGYFMYDLATAGARR
jgi:hypothetical protein